MMTDKQNSDGGIRGPTLVWLFRYKSNNAVWVMSLAQAYRVCQTALDDLHHIVSAPLIQLINEFSDGQVQPFEGMVSQQNPLPWLCKGKQELQRQPVFDSYC